MESKHKAMIAIGVLMAFIAIFLFDVYAPQYLLPIYLLLLTWPLVFAAGRNWERHICDNFLNYLEERGYLQDYSQPPPPPQTRASGQPVREVAQGEAVRQPGLRLSQPEAWKRSRVRQRPPRPN